jgi:hypothetical protein
MSRTRLIDFLEKPDALDEKSLSHLKEVLEAYPFFQTGRMLWIKNLHNMDHIRYNSELKIAAAFIPDRSKLFFLINDIFTPLVESEPSERLEQPADGIQPSEQDNLSDSPKVKLPDPRSDSDAIISSEADQEAEADAEGFMDRVIGDDANYFEVDDAVTTDTGELIDFSLSLSPDDPKEDSEVSSDIDDMVLPSADLLDYEKETYSTYSLEQKEDSEPLDFRESHSFSQWLNLLRHQAAPNQEQRAPELEESTEGATGNNEGMDLIENFLNHSAKQSRIVPAAHEITNNEDFSAKSTEENEDLMTETLANIHIKQERYHKAIEIFERLRLKYPEKSIYFARRIAEMEELINNQ